MGALTIALPPLAGVALETVLSVNDRLAAKGQLQASRMFQVVIASFLVFESVLATLAGTHYSPPGSLDCALRGTWEKLYRGHHGKSIRTIQDTFDCCGFSDQQDMAWPFPNATRGSDACLLRYEREQACLQPWREEERKVAIMLMVVPIAVFVWQVRTTANQHKPGVADANAFRRSLSFSRHHHSLPGCQVMAAQTALLRTRNNLQVRDIAT